MVSAETLISLEDVNNGKRLGSEHREVKEDEIDRDRGFLNPLLSF